MLNQRAEAEKPPKMQVMGCNVGSSSKEDDNSDDISAEPPPAKGRRGKRSKAAACLCGRGGGEGAAVETEEPLSSSAVARIRNCIFYFISLVFIIIK